MKLNLVILLLMIFSASCDGQKKTTGDQDHRLFNGLLKKYVTSSGSVDYAGLKKDKSTLEKYLNELSENTPDNSWSKNASLAYWINAYNAFTLKLIVDNYPLKSITDLDNGKPWDVKRISLGNKKYSLNNIENDIIRPQYKDARIHFAVNCAAISCPPLLNKAFTEGNINELLDARAKNFINSSANQLSSSKIKVSKIFDWYKEDFGDITAFINKYSRTKINGNAAISYQEYNWKLNGNK